VKKTPSLTLTQQLQIAICKNNGWKTDNARFKTRYCAYRPSQEKDLFSGGGSRGLYTQL